MNRLKGARVKRTQARRAHQEGGYTVIELVMAMGVFAIGITGISAMQAATSASNRHAKNLAIANAIAKTWHEELAVDATQWTWARLRGSYR
jgi:Tfp pilus assembly protein PilV